jgi:hypothetical protein
MGVSCVCESCTNHSPQITEAKISAKSRPNFDATPHGENNKEEVGSTAGIV